MHDIEDNKEIELKREISQILHVDISDSWIIAASQPDKNLYLVHYQDDADMTIYGHLRGIVIDLKTRTVVCDSFGYNPAVVVTKFTKRIDGNYHLQDVDGNNHIVNPTSAEIKISFEGVIVRFFKHDGIVYRSTHRRLNMVNSRWGNSKLFSEIYKELNGPNDDVLFRNEFANSPYCHFFMMVHPDLLIVTKQKIGRGYIGYLGNHQMYSPHESPYGNENTDPEVHLPTCVNEFIQPHVDLSPYLLNSYDIDMHEASKFFQKGYYTNTPILHH